MAHTATLPAALEALLQDAIAEEIRRFPHDAPTVPDVMGTAYVLCGVLPIEYLDEWVDVMETRLADLVAR